MLLIDTSSLVGSLAGSQPAKPALIKLIEAGERILLPTLVLYEFWRGPRSMEELARQEELLPSDATVPFGPEQARVAAGLYRKLGRSRNREIDVAIAAHALVAGAKLWTQNQRDFADIPGLELHLP